MYISGGVVGILLVLTIFFSTITDKSCPLIEKKKKEKKDDNTK